MSVENSSEGIRGAMGCVCAARKELRLQLSGLNRAYTSYPFASPPDAEAHEYTYHGMWVRSDSEQKLVPVFIADSKQGQLVRKMALSESNLAIGRESRDPKGLTHCNR